MSIQYADTTEQPKSRAGAGERARVPQDSSEVNDKELRSFVERIARLTEERKAIADDIADILKEAVSRGFVKASLKETVKAYSEDADARLKRRETDGITAAYLSAMGLA